MRICNSKKRAPPLARHGAHLLLLLLCLLARHGQQPGSEVAAKGAHKKAPKNKGGGGEFFQQPGVHVSEIVRARGYLAEEHQIVTDDGYVLGMTRAHNPLVSRRRARALARQPLLLVHGTLADGNSFVTNSFELRKPDDWSAVDADKLSEEQLAERFADEPAAKSLAFFAMNFGHEVWFLHRRGSPMAQRRLEESLVRARPPPVTPMQKYLKSVAHTRRLLAGSSAGAGASRKTRPRLRGRPRRASSSGDQEGEKKTGATTTTTGSGSKLLEALKATPGALFHGHLLRDIQVTFDRRLWNHSLDEQAAWDLPRAVDYVLESSGFERLALVGDSSGGALIMMALILEQSLNDKLSKAVAWVPSFHIGHAPNEGSFAPVQPVFRYLGPYPLTFASLPLQAFVELACSLEILEKTLCRMGLDANWGPTQGKQRIHSEYAAGALTPVSAHEYLHLIQMHTRKATRMFDFNNREENLRAYGQPDTPRYNASLINFEHLSIFVGTVDSLVTEKDIATVHKELRVPHRIVTMRAKGANHGAVLFHDEVATMVIIPTYKDIVSHGYRPEAQGPRWHPEGQVRRAEPDDDGESERFFNEV